MRAGFVRDSVGRYDEHGNVKLLNYGAEARTELAVASRKLRIFDEKSRLGEETIALNMPETMTFLLRGWRQLIQVELEERHSQAVADRPGKFPRAGRPRPDDVYDRPMVASRSPPEQSFSACNQFAVGRRLRRAHDGAKQTGSMGRWTGTAKQKLHDAFLKP